MNKAKQGEDMENNNNSIFRNKSLKKISSPEQLDNYLVVTGPGIWFTLIAIIVLLIGVFTWCVLGKLETTLDVAVISKDDNVVCYIPADKKDIVLESGYIKINNQKYKLDDIGYAKKIITSDTDVNIRLAGNLDENSVVSVLKIDSYLPDGIYNGEVVVETVKPISFIIN